MSCPLDQALNKSGATCPTALLKVPLSFAINGIPFCQGQDLATREAAASDQRPQSLFAVTMTLKDVERWGIFAIGSRLGNRTRADRTHQSLLKIAELG